MTKQADKARARAASCRARAHGCDRSAGPLVRLSQIGDTPERRAGAAVDVEISNARSDTWNSAAAEFEALAAELDASDSTPVRDHDRLEQCLVLLNDLCGPLGVEPGASMFGKEGLRERAIELRSAYVALVKERSELELASLHFERALVAIVNDPHAGAAEVAAVARKALAARDPDRPGRIKTANQAGELALDPEAPRVLAAKAATAHAGAVDRPHGGPGVLPPTKADVPAAVAHALGRMWWVREYLGMAESELTQRGGPSVGEGLHALDCADVDLASARAALRGALSSAHAHPAADPRRCGSLSSDGHVCHLQAWHEGQHQCDTGSVNGLTLSWRGPDEAAD